ncbi:MAG: hypothetical protein HQM14_08095 [SAR324 cluster bacterium]|nr:hypothetical protein [SAR324 cluster bacterium]
MPDSSKKPSSNKSVTSLIKTNAIKDPDQYLQDRIHEVEQWKEYWKEKQEEYFEKDFDTNAPSVIEASEIRRFLNQFLRKKLDDIKKSDADSRQQTLRLMLPFNTEAGITEFLLHFFQLEKADGTLNYIERDSFEKEVHILYDIYKIKKTIECIDVMRRTIGNPEKQFRSRFPEEEKKVALDQLREVMKVLFKFTIAPDKQKDLYQSISMDLISPESILERREKNFFYCYPHVIEKYDYRNLFFLIYFREGLSAKIGKEQKKFEYNYTNFEVLKQEFLSDWLEKRLKNNPEKQKIYETYEIDNRTIADWLEEDPSQEIPLLKKLPLNKFNNLIAQVDENVDDDLKAEMSSMSEKHGEMAEFRTETKKAAKMAKSPLNKLKSFLGFGKKEEELPMEEAPTNTTPEPEPEPEWKITSLNIKQAPYYYLCQSASKYKGKLAMVRTKMGGEFENLNKLVAKLMKAFGESGVVRRRTPKHDWTVPYLMKYVVGDTSTDYLFILGGEAKVKSKGMGYSTGDEYAYTPYVVFATAEPDEQYGAIEGERPVRSRTFNEYSITNEAVRNKVVEFMQLIQEKEFPTT